MKKVEVYLDRRAMGRSKKRIYSIRDTQTSRVFTKNSNIILQNVELVVQPRGRQITIEKLANGDIISRTVHAFLRGELVRRGKNAMTLGKLCFEQDSINVGYDPLKTPNWIALDSFKMPDIVQTSRTITHAAMAFLHADGIQVSV